MCHVGSLASQQLWVWAQSRLCREYQVTQSYATRTCLKSQRAKQKLPSRALVLYALYIWLVFKLFMPFHFSSSKKVSRSWINNYLSDSSFWCSSVIQSNDFRTLWYKYTIYSDHNQPNILSSPFPGNKKIGIYVSKWQWPCKGFSFPLGKEFLLDYFSGNGNLEMLW